MAFRAVHAQWGTVFAHLPDLGCGRHWAQVWKTRPPAPLTCDECGHGMYAKTSRTGLRFFAHAPGAPTCSLGLESVAHHLLKLELANAARDAGAHARPGGADVRAGEGAQPPSGGDGGQGEGGLGDGEDVAETLAGAAAERDERVTGGLLLVGVPSVGIETLGVPVQLAAVMKDVGAEGEVGARAQLVPAECGVLGDHTGEEPGRRVQPQHFGDDAAGQRQPRDVLRAGGAPGQDGVDLVVQPVGDMGVTVEQVERPGQDARRGLGAGEEERDDLVGDFGIAQPLAEMITYEASYLLDLAADAGALPRAGRGVLGAAERFSSRPPRSSGVRQDRRRLTLRGGERLVALLV
jgi:hypothetical protein